jgi:hypothetical protein
MNSASLCSLAGRYDNPIPPWFLAPIDFLKIPALTGKEERTTIGCRRGEIRVTQKLHIKKLDCYPLLFTF